MSNNQGQAQDAAAIMASAMKAAEDLYNIRDTYFPSNPVDKISRLQSHSDLALNLLDSIPSEMRERMKNNRAPQRFVLRTVFSTSLSRTTAMAAANEKIFLFSCQATHDRQSRSSTEQRKLPTQRATYEYLRGKILDVFPDYRKEAEDHLSKAVKLSPSLADAWLCLGNCIWKKGDLPSAKNCFTLALSKGPNKKILSQLSMLERRMAQGADNQAEIVEESIKHAKEAIMLDVKDGNSWCKDSYRIYLA